jgi:hypothetical protein
MWILPKNYPLSSHFVADMVASKEDLTLPDLNIESSLMSRSKPTRLRTWQTRWKEGSYYQHLFGRILKPYQYSLFETKLTSLLAAIHVSPLVQQGSEKETKTLDTCGHTYGDTSKQLDLFESFLKTSKDTSALDLEKSLATWKALVTEQRGEYSQRVKLALRTKESESTSWATPRTTDSAGGARTLNDKGQRISVSDPTKTYGANLSDQVRHWPTPSARDHKGAVSVDRTHEKLKQGHRAHMGTLDAYSVYHETYGPPDLAKTNTRGKPVGHLNPDWVEQLMGLPTGWTELGSWGTE